MKIFALVVVKNESDIIYDTIISATLWADKIFIIDNMSTDSTWDKLNEIKKESEKVILWGRYGGKFNDCLRQIIFNEYKSYANDNDWWCRLDGDEFYIDDPRSFLSMLSKDIDHVYNASFQYYLTESNYNDLRNGKCDGVAIYKNLEWYKCNHSEIRFVKNKPGICWPQNEGWPCNLINPADVRIRLKHFQYRSLHQVEERLSLRSVSHLGDVFKHEIVSESDWYLRRGFSIPQKDELKRYRIVNESDLVNDSDYIYSDMKLPPIVKSSIIKKIKCVLVSIYMRFFNKHLFKI